MGTAMTQTHVQMISAVNAGAIKKETIDGEPHYRIPSVTLPDDVIMNGGLYPADEIDKSYRSLEGKPAPLGHPQVNGQFISASSPRAMNQYNVGAWNENVRREGGRVLLDKVLNIRVAQQTEKGRELLEAIAKQSPIHTSTGIVLQRDTAANGEVNGKAYAWVARNMSFDHDAILLGQVGAATPADGVGLFVNAEGAAEQCELLVCNIGSDDYGISDNDDFWLREGVESILKGITQKRAKQANQGLIEKLIGSIKSAIGVAQDAPSEIPATNSQAKGESMKPEELKAALNEALEPITNQLKAHGENIQKLQANAEAQQKAVEAKQAEERQPLEERAKASGLTDEDVMSMSTNALKTMFGASAKPPQGFSLNTRMPEPAGNEQKTYEVPD